MTLRLHLQIVGALQIVLALSHVAFPRRFHWREETARLSLLNQQIFYVHTFFLCLVLIFFGLLNLACANQLLRPDPLAKCVLVGITIFWILRWMFQFFVYDVRLWKGNRFNTCAHVAFAFIWTYFAAVYSLALWRQFSY